MNLNSPPMLPSLLASASALSLYWHCASIWRGKTAVVIGRWDSSSMPSQKKEPGSIHTTRSFKKAALISQIGPTSTLDIVCDEHPCSLLEILGTGGCAESVSSRMIALRN